MKSYFGLSSALIATTVMVASAQSAWAAATQVTAVKVQSTDNGIELVLTTNKGDRPQVFSSSRQEQWVADVINTQLKLPTNTPFQQENPAPGIAKVEVVALDTNSIRVIVTGDNAAPTGQLSNRDAQGLAFSIQSANSGSVTATSASPSQNSGTAVAQANGSRNPEVLVPNPEVTVSNNQPTAIPRPNPAPPLLPRAVAPPLGDIAKSDLAPGFTSIDLGTAQRVPRLVLRDAPAREVLALLARAADLNLAFIGSGGGGTSSGSSDSSSSSGGSTSSGAEGPSITLDIENEPVQDVFNYVLRLTELEAVINGRTILVGPDLPPEVQAQNTSIRTLRVNQANAATVAAFLSAQGAETQRVVTKTTRTEEGTGVDRRIREDTTTTIEPLAANTTTTGAPLLLKGLSIVTDDRLNSVTLIGESRLIELATSLTRQLDLRQRQVAVNVKVVDVTLDNTSSLTSNFSFGINDTYVVSSGGVGLVRFGQYRPPTSTETNDSLFSQPIITNPYSTTDTALDLSSTFNIPGAAGDTIINDDRQGFQVIDGGDATFFNRELSLSGDPLDVNVSDFTRGTDTTVTITTNEATGARTTTISRGTQATSTVTPTSLFQFPSRFLADVQAQVVSGNAKILTDPTLVVQEGQSASVKLTQQIITNVTETPSQGDGDPAINNEFSDVGLVLTIAVSRVDDNGFVTMEIQPRISTPVGSQSVQTSLGPFTVSQIGSRELNSGRIRLRDGQTLILAGIITEQEQENVTKWPLLGDLPILGALFRQTTSNHNRSEVVIVVTPQIMDDSEASSFGYHYIPSPEVQQVLDRGR